MKMFKFFLVVIILVFGVQFADAQVYKFQTTGFSVMEKMEKGGWSNWSKLEKSEMIITLDTKKDRIVVYSQEVQLYKILKYREKEESATDIVQAFDCQDNDGELFTISIITRKNQNNRKQLYINQKSVVISYNIITIK